MLSHIEDGPRTQIRLARELLCSLRVSRFRIYYVPRCFMSPFTMYIGSVCVLIVSLFKYFRRIKMGRQHGRYSQLTQKSEILYSNSYKYFVPHSELNGKPKWIEAVIYILTVP